MIINPANGEILPAAHAVQTQTQKKPLERGAMITAMANREVLPAAHAVQTTNTTVNYSSVAR